MKTAICKTWDVSVPVLISKINVDEFFFSFSAASFKKKGHTAHYDQKIDASEHCFSFIKNIFLIFISASVTNFC